MADLFRNFLDLRPSSTNYYKLHLRLPSNNFSIGHSFSSSFRKINRKQLLCKPASPAIDVISTHEHSDGSLVFRFGDPSEVVELEKPVIVVEEIESAGVEESGVVKDLDRDYQNKVSVEKGEKEVNGSSLTEVLDESGLVVLEKPVIVDEEIEKEWVLESGAVEDLNGDRENEVVVYKAEREVNVSSFTEVLDAFDPVELEKPMIVDEDIENEGVIESSAVGDLDGGRENEVMVDKAEREVNGSSLTEVPDELDHVELEKQVIVHEEIENERVIESSAVEDVDGDRGNKVMVKEAEREDNGSGLTELADEFDSVELETTVTVDEEIESDVMGQSSIVKVLDGDHESEVMIKEAEGKVGSSTLTELPNEFNPVVIIEGGNESSGLEDELSVPMSSVAVEVSSSPEPDIQNIGYDQEVLNEDHEDLSLQNVPVADEISEIENSIVTEEFSEKTIGNAITLQAVPLEPENSISQSSTGLAVTVDDLLVSEHQNVDAALHNGTMTVEDSTSYSEVAENSTDVSVDSVEAESKHEGYEDGIEIDSSDLLSNPSNLQVDVSLPEEVECEISQVSVQTVKLQNERESCVNDIAAKSHQLGADITNIEAQTSETGTAIKNKIVKYESESDMMQFTSMPPRLEAESQNEINDDGREIGSSELLSNSPNPQVDVSLSEIAEGQTSQVPFQSVVTGTENEINTDIVSSSPQLEAAINLSTETETRTSATGIGITNEIVKDEGESGVIHLTSMSPPLVAEPKLDVEMVDGIVEEFKEDEVTGNDGSDIDMIQLTPVLPQEKVQSNLHEGTDGDSLSLEELRDDKGVESPSMTNDVPQDLVLEQERIRGDDNLQISQLPVVSGNEMVEPESAEYDRNSEEIAMEFVLSFGAASLPHPTKVLTGGEDAYFVTGQTWLGVADGVLQWSLDGTNPGVYAQDLIRSCEKLASDCIGNSISYPLDLLKSSVAETLSPGCSTVLLARLDGQVLHVANVGDSGFIILRHGTVYKRSLPMLHAFHLPLQIERDDDPSRLAELYQVDLEEDDVLVTATDGLFDNLYDQEISSIVFKSLATDLKLEEIAELLATKAQEVGRSTSSRSPFADSAQAAGYVGYTGGKLDDVTVIVSVVHRRSSSLTL